MTKALCLNAMAPEAFYSFFWLLYFYHGFPKNESEISGQYFYAAGSYNRYNVWIRLVNTTQVRRKFYCIRFFIETIDENRTTRGNMFHNFDRPYSTPFGQVVVYL